VKRRERDSCTTCGTPRTSPTPDPASRQGRRGSRYRFEKGVATYGHRAGNRQQYNTCHSVGVIAGTSGTDERRTR